MSNVSVHPERNMSTDPQGIFESVRSALLVVPVNILSGTRTILESGISSRV